MFGISKQTLAMAVLFLLAEAVIMSIQDRPLGKVRQRLLEQRAWQTARAVLFCVVLSACSLRCLFYEGFTARTETGFAALASFQPTLNSVIRYLLFFLVMLEVFEHPVRGALAFCMYLLYDLYPSWQNRLYLLIELGLLCSLSNLSWRRWTAWSWLISHALYALSLAVLLHVGYAESTTRPRALFGLIFQGSSFGMGHPNSLGVLIASLTFLIWYIIRPKKWGVTLALCLCAAALNWFVTFSRTAALMILVLPVMHILVRQVLKSGKKPLITVMLLLPVIMLALTFLLYPLFRANPRLLDPAFAMRFTDVGLLGTIGVRPIADGSWMDPYFSRTFMLDNFYVWMLATCGWIPCLLVLAGHTGSNVLIMRQKDEHLLVLSMVFAVYGLMENIPAYIAFNFLGFLFFADAASPGKGKTENAVSESAAKA